MSTEDCAQDVLYWLLTAFIANAWNRNVEWIIYENDVLLIDTWYERFFMFWKFYKIFKSLLKENRLANVVPGEDGWKCKLFYLKCWYKCKNLIGNENSAVMKLISGCLPILLSFTVHSLPRHKFNDIRTSRQLSDTFIIMFSFLRDRSQNHRSFIIAFAWQIETSLPIY